MNYEVQKTDTLAGIAAAHDCTVGELVKLNRLPTRMVSGHFFLFFVLSIFRNFSLVGVELGHKKASSQSADSFGLHSGQGFAF